MAPSRRVVSQEEEFTAEPYAKPFVRAVSQLVRRKGGGGHGSSTHGGGTSTHGSGSSSSGSSTHGGGTSTHGSGSSSSGSSTHGGGTSTHGSGSSSSGSSSSSGGSSTNHGSGTSGGTTSPAARHGASSTFMNSQGAQSFSISKSGSKKGSATPYSDGGGTRFILGAGTTFSGREAGGSDRTYVYGTSRFGSGYPYGGYGTYVASRPFPYVFYPSPPANHYYGGQEFLDTTDRPGGNLSTAIIQPSYNTSLVTYRILGDSSSVLSVLDALIANCSVANSSSSISAYAPSPSTWPLPEQIIQYYRASSFSLSLDGYNNSAALPSNMPTSNSSASLPLDQDTPLPAGLNITFLACVNTTIGVSVPLMDAEKHGLSSAMIGLIVFLSIAGAKAIAWIIYWLYRRHNRVKRTLRDSEGVGYVVPEGPKPVKGSRWFSSIPFVKRFGYRTVPGSQAEKYEDDHDLQDIPSPTGRKSISEDNSAEPPPYSKESYDKPLDGTKENADHKMPEDDTTIHIAQSEHTHNNEKN